MIPERVDVAQGSAAKERLEFREELFDRIEVWRVRRQVANRGARGFDSFTDASDLVTGQVVGDDHIAGAEGGAEELPHVREEAGAIHGPVEDQRGRHRVTAQGGDESGGLPVPVGRGPATAFAPGRAAPGGRHRGVDPGFVDEHQPSGIPTTLVVLPLMTCLLHVGAFLLAGVQRFF